MKTEIILLIKYLISIYLLSIIFFIISQKIYNRLYCSRRKNKTKYIDRCNKDGNASSHQKLKINKINKYKYSSIKDNTYKYSSKNKIKRLTKEERKKIKQKYKLAS